MTSLQLPLNKRPMMEGSMGSHYSLYQQLTRAPNEIDQDFIREYLADQLNAAEFLATDLPSDLSDLIGWVTAKSHAAAANYRTYLEGRKNGERRKYFSNRAHALYFLQHVAPTKLVDGAWLYGTIKHTQDWRFRGLVRTYLEELGDGDPALNHVYLYRNLLDEHDCFSTLPLDDSLYCQGAIQLALGLVVDEFLPEVLGYNLGYEVLPLHLLITAFELNELGIDPHYFTLHVTIDNASSGHALKAVEAILNLAPNDSARSEFLKRLRAGYLLNDLGKNSTDVIQSFDIEREVVAMLEHKATFGRHMHSDYCQLEGRSINQWLSTPGQIREFLTALETKGWIKRHQCPQDSRFWQLIEGPSAAMFGVFNGYEKQLMKDWISGDRQETVVQAAEVFRNQFRRRETLDYRVELSPSLASVSVEDLIALMAPSSHATPEGLAATKIFSQRYSHGALTS